VTDTQRGSSGRGPEPGERSQDTGGQGPKSEDPEPATGARSQGSPDDGAGPWQRFQDWREAIRRRPAADRIYRLTVAVLGGVIVVGGLALVPLPGPGWLIVFVGLALLATEFEWAHRLEQYVRKRVSDWTHWLGRQSLSIRIMFALLTAGFVAAFLYAVLRVLGVPGWIPDGFVAVIPGLTP
jgi:uncharacterized protein (TIGR02611 family)